MTTIEYSFDDLQRFLFEEYARSDEALGDGDFETARANLQNCRDAIAACRRLLARA